MFEKTLLRGLMTLAFATTMFAGTAHGSLIAYDGFAYSAGSSLAGQNGGQGFSGAWYTGGYNVSQSVSLMASGSLTYPSLATTGNQVTSVSTSSLNGVERNLSNSISSGTIYLSCLLSPQATLDQGNGGGFFGVYLHGSSADLFMGKSSVNGSDCYDLEQRGASGQAASPAVPVVGQSEFLVLKANLVSSGLDTFTLYTDPTPGAPEPSSGTVKGDLNIGTLSSLVLYSGGAFSIDELRVGTSYADVTPAAAPSSTWAAAVSGSWSNAGNWTAGAPNAIGAVAVINASTTAALTITLDAPQTLGTLLLGNSAAAGVGYTLNGTGANTITLNNSGGGATITVTDGTHVVNAPVVLNDNLTLSNSGSLTLAGAITNGSNGPMGIGVISGHLALAGSNTYSGDTTIRGGTVTLAHGLAVQDSTVNVTNSGTLSFAAGITGPTLGGLGGDGNVALVTAAAEPVMLNVGNNGQSTTYGGTLSGAGGLTKQGSATLTLTAPGVYSGPTVISGGVVQLQAPLVSGAIGIHFVGIGSTFSGSGGVVPMSNWNNESGYSFSGSALVNSSGISSGATFTLSGANSIWLTESTNQLLNGYVAVSNNNPMTLTVSNIPYARYSIYAYVGDSGVGNQEKATINGTSYYFATVGGTPSTYMAITSTSSANYQPGNYIEVDGLTGSSQTVNLAGTTQQFGGLCSVEIVNTAAVVANLLPATTTLNIAASSTLDLGGGNQQVASLSGGGTVSSSNTSSASVLTISPTGGSTTFSGMIQGGATLGTINLVFSGSGTQVLSGSNTYTGPTAVNQGQLVVNGSMASPLTVNRGGILAGTGSLSSVTVNPGGNLAPGDSLGTLSVSGSLILSSGAVMDYELDTPTTSGMINAGTLSLNGQQFTDFTFTPTANFGPGIYNLIDASSVSGTGLGANTGGSVDGYAASLAVQGDDLVLTVVPEPSTLGLLGIGAIGLAGYGWRRRAVRRTPKPTSSDQQDSPAILSVPLHASPATTTRRAA